MNNNVLTIMKKELHRFFGDKRLFFTTVLMPGLMIYVMYSIMGNTMMKQFSTDEDFRGTVIVDNMPEGFESAFDTLNLDVVLEPDQSTQEKKEQVSEEQVNAYVVFPEDFSQKVAQVTGSGYTGQDSDGNIDINSGDWIPNIMVYYVSTNTESQTVYSTIVAMLDSFESSVANVFDVNNFQDTNETGDLASKEDATGMLFSMMLPFLLLTFIFTGCMSISIDSIAGEKERGTIATLLVTPMKRSQLALGKILSLSIIGLLSGVSSFAGTALSLPNLMGDSMGEINAAVYGPIDYLYLLFIILSTVLVVVAAISVVSALCRNIKEASTAVTPLMLVVMFIGLSSMFAGTDVKPIWTRCIPIYNSVVAMGDIFAFNYRPADIWLGVGANLIMATILVVVLAKIFDSEKIMNS